MREGAVDSGVRVRDDERVFDINAGEFLVLGAVAVVVLGPERLPTYAAQLGSWVRQARTFARSAREQVRSEMGEDFDDIDWEALDPRRYDPRRIVRDALLDDDDEPRRTGVSDSAPNVPAAMRPDPVEPIDLSKSLDLSKPERAHGSTAAERVAPTYDADAT